MSPRADQIRCTFAEFTPACFAIVRHDQCVWPSGVECSVNSTISATFSSLIDGLRLYDAVATMDTIMLIRSALRGLLGVADGALAAELRAVLSSGDDYLATGEDGVFHIARRVAPDRMISTVDPQPGTGYKTPPPGVDGYVQGPRLVDPDSELITATTVTLGNAGDAAAAQDLITDLLDDTTEHGERTGSSSTSVSRRSPARPGSRPDPACRCWWGYCLLAQACSGCPLRAQCTSSKAGRTVSMGRTSRPWPTVRARQVDPAWVADYRATRPKVERKLGHLMRCKHGER